MAKVSTHIKRAVDRVNLAQTYAEDGALHSAARCLREASHHMEAAAQQKQRDLDALIAAGEPMRVA